MNKTVQHRKTTHNRKSQDAKHKNKLFFAILIALIATVCLAMATVLIIIPNFELAHEKKQYDKASRE